MFVYVLNHHRDGHPPWHLGSKRSLAAAVEVAWNLHPEVLLRGCALQGYTVTRILVNDTVQHPETFFAEPDPNAVYSLDEFKKCWRKAGVYPYDHSRRLPGKPVVVKRQRFWGLCT